MITRREGGIVPIPFDELIDPATHKTRVREVDTSTESHAIATALQVRFEAGDADNRELLEQMGAVIGLDADATRERYADAAIQAHRT